jgi:hypothetical protein
MIGLLCLAAATLRAQVDTQLITGIVLDPSGAVVQGAAITVTNNATGLSRAVKSNESGVYTALNLPVGTYSVTTTMARFKKSVINGVIVDVGSKPAVPVTLQLGEAGETIVVQADAMEIQTTSAEIGATISSQLATQIQLNGRNYVQLLTLAPGVSQTVASGFAIFGKYGANGNSQSVNGVRVDSANFFIDGVDNKDNGGGGNNFVNISPDALAEFRDAASTYDASYGGSSGATVSVAIRSGGKAFHGVTYEYLRNDAIQGYSFIPIGGTVVKPPLRYNNYGYTVGGPIYIPNRFNADKSKLFFFWAQDFKNVRTATIGSYSVPTPTALAAAQAGPSTATGLALSNTLETSATGVYSYLNEAPSDQKEYVIKGDYIASSRNQFSGHFVHDLYNNLGDQTDYILYHRRLPGLTSSGQWTHTLSDRTVNVLTGSFSGNIIYQTNPSGIIENPQFNKPILRSNYGLTYATLYNASLDIPQITVTGYSLPTVTPLVFDNYQRIYAVKDDFSHVMGNHTLRAGAYVWRGRKNQTAPPALNGQFTFSSLANLVEGNFSSYTEGSSTPQVQARFTQAEFYAQDDWKVSRNLTLNLGLRWQYMEPISSWPNNASGFWPQYYSATQAATVSPTSGLITSAPSPYNGLVLPGSGFPAKAADVIPASIRTNSQVLALFHNLPEGLVNTNYNTFAPRFGFAWDMSGRQTTVLRGGFGISYERVEGNYYYSAVTQEPFVNVASLASAGNADSLGSVGLAASPQNITNTSDPNLAPPRIYNYSLGIQRRLTKPMLFEVSYVGTHSGNDVWVKDLNQAAPGTEQANPGVARNALRPYLGYGEICQFLNGSKINYNSLQSRLQIDLSQGGIANVSYTWSKTLTDAESYAYSPQNSLNLHADYGPANYSQPQILAVSYVYRLPFWLHDHQWYKQPLSGWQVSGVTRIASGLPINVVQPSGVSTAGALVVTNLTLANTTFIQRPNLVGNVGGAYSHAGKQYINPAAFSVPTAGTFGSFENGGIKGPWYDNWDAALQKNIPIHDSIAMEFRAEMFNVPNHLSPFTVASTLGKPTSGAYTQNNNFGQVTGAADPRTMEFALRIRF